MKKTKSKNLVNTRNLTICVATEEECNLLNCKRRKLHPTPDNQSYANFSLDYQKIINDKTVCEAYFGYGKLWDKATIKIN